MSKRVLILLAAGIVLILGAFVLLKYESESKKKVVNDDYPEDLLEEEVKKDPELEIEKKDPNVAATKS